jgi:hypothetical protein
LPRDHHWLRLASRIHRFLGATWGIKSTEIGSKQKSLFGRLLKVN